MLAQADTIVAAAAARAVTTLPDTIELLSICDLSWPMAQLRDNKVRLDLLSLEALA